MKHSETSLVHEKHFRSSKSVIMCLQHMQETLQNNPSYENLSGAQHGSRTFFSVLCVLIVAVAFDWAAFSRILEQQQQQQQVQNKDHHHGRQRCVWGGGAAPSPPTPSSFFIFKGCLLSRHQHHHHQHQHHPQHPQQP